MVRRLLAGDKAKGRPAPPALAPGVEEARHGKYCCAHKVHQQILHGVHDTDVKVAADSQLLSVHLHLGNLLQGHHLVAAAGVQRHCMDAVDDRILLHVGMEKEVHGKLEEFPQHADGHGKAEGGEGKEKGGQVEGRPLKKVSNFKA